MRIPGQRLRDNFSRSTKSSTSTYNFLEYAILFSNL